MSARGLFAKPTTRQVMVYICVFLYQGYDILFYCEAHSPPPKNVGRLISKYVDRLRFIR
jgi:hypothetical protein